MSRNRARPLSLEFTRDRSRGTSPKCSRVPSASAASMEQRVVAHGAVAQRTPAAGIVAGHAADGGARGGRDVDRKPQAVLFELPVEVVEHDPRLDHAGAVFDVERDDAIQVFGEVDDDAVIDGLAALRGAAAARRDDPPGVAADRQRPQRLVDGARHHHARRHDLVERGVGRIAAAVERVEEHVARDLARQPVLERHRALIGHSIPAAAAGDAPAQATARNASFAILVYILNAKYRLIVWLTSGRLGRGRGVRLSGARRRRSACCAGARTGCR